MTTTTLLLLGLGSIAAILLLIIKGKVHPFITLMSVALVLALAAGIPLAEVAPLLIEGMGSTLGSVALIVTLGAILGRIIEVSGGADVLARWLLNTFGEKRAPFALGATGFIFGIPVFVDVGLIVLIPIIFGVARRLQGSMLKYALPIAGAMLAVHCVVPPHPGIVGGSQLLSADIGLVMIFGLIAAVPMWLVAHFVAKPLAARNFVPVSASDTLQSVGGTGAMSVTSTRTPSVLLVLSTIVLPLALIMGGTTFSVVLGAENPLTTVFSLVGASHVALLIGVIYAAGVLGFRFGWSRDDVENVINSALPPVAAVILITGAGGMFGYSLRETGVAEAVADLLGSTGLPIIFLGWLLAIVIRGAQGSATVAMLTTAPLVAPLLTSMSLEPVQIALVAVAIGAGTMGLSHVNDSMFWIWSRYFAVPVSTSLKTWTLVSTVASVTGLIVVWIMWLLVSAVL
ncbi:GntT protein [Kocuria coralli]|uniref:GntT protein n=1 Tax=Kocuria coralli TaxID=1461025 RepID=A0A5J5KZ76_9MICC|nr:gluconate:H+ symporter [Kocuria coralli]KAA9394862.1 GntT protein [Kocuria coralli]